MSTADKDPLDPGIDETGTDYRVRLVDALAESHEKTRTHRGFVLARISKAKFGIVDRDRADFLGLSFEVHMLEPNGGAAWLYLTRDESLKMLEEIGEAEILNGKLCWVYLSGPGSSPVRFVRLVKT